MDINHKREADTDRTLFKHTFIQVSYKVLIGKKTILSGCLIYGFAQLIGQLQ